jgi:hypothetical protein
MVIVTLQGEGRKTATFEIELPRNDPRGIARPAAVRQYHWGRHQRQSGAVPHIGRPGDVIAWLLIPSRIP